jgi:hypothetical protein
VGTTTHLVMAGSDASLLATPAETSELWHQRLGHPGPERMRVVSGMVKGIDVPLTPVPTADSAPSVGSCSILCGDQCGHRTIQWYSLLRDLRV